MRPGVAEVGVFVRPGSLMRAVALLDRVKAVVETLPGDGWAVGLWTTLQINLTSGHRRVHIQVELIPGHLRSLSRRLTGSVRLEPRNSA